LVAKHSLEARIQAAYESVQQHPLHALEPHWRKAIYDAIGPLYLRKSRIVRTHLAINAAKFVLPVWQRTRAHDHRCEQLIDIAIDQLHKQQIDEANEQRFGEEWNWLSNDYEDRSEELASDAFFAMATALKAVAIVFGDDGWLTVIIDETTTDADLDPWSTDAAAYGAAAFAGPIWEQSSSSDARRQYWEWWLFEANLEAYEAAATFDSMPRK
jgi:hypothetical protein